MAIMAMGDPGAFATNESKGTRGEGARAEGAVTARKPPTLRPLQLAADRFQLPLLRKGARKSSGFLGVWKYYGSVPKGIAWEEGNKPGEAS